MRILKISLSVIALIVLVLIIAIGSLFIFLDPNKLKPMITSEISRNTGYETLVDGNLSWSFYPILGVKLDKLQLREPGQPIAFLELNGLSIATEFSQLLHGQSELQGRIYIESIRLDKLHLQNAAIKLGWQHHVLTMQPIKASLYGGTLRGVVHARELSATPKWDWDIAASNLDLQPLLVDLLGKNSKVMLVGTGDIRLAANTAGREQRDLLTNLNGLCQFGINEGLVDGIDLNYLVTSANALVNHENLSSPETPFKTAFDRLSGLFKIKAGQAETDNLLLQSKAFTVTGQGGIDLPLQSLDLKLQLKPLERVKTRWLIPVLITGEIKAPSVRLDTLTLNTLITKEELDKLKEKAQDVIKTLPEKADKFIGKLLGE